MGLVPPSPPHESWRDAPGWWMLLAIAAIYGVGGLAVAALAAALAAKVAEGR